METVKEILERLKTCKEGVMWIGNKTIREDDGISEIHITDNLRSNWNEKAWGKAWGHTEDVSKTITEDISEIHTRNGIRKARKF